MNFFNVIYFLSLFCLNITAFRLKHARSLNCKDFQRKSFSSESEESDITTISYSWRNKWYAVCFEKDFSCGAVPLAYSIFDYPFVLWRDSENNLCCVDDICPHRAAKLSEGLIRDGHIECRYHGWQFSRNGSCAKIPQLAEGAVIPKAANLRHYEVQVREGIVWMYATPILEAKFPLPNIPITQIDLDKNELKSKFSVYDFQIDLPYEHSFLVENLLVNHKFYGYRLLLLITNPLLSNRILHIFQYHMIGRPEEE
jgi:phenylpropionate dioxygenase-like ring-hydroxylating dioxygenase large terminal subunit